MAIKTPFSLGPRPKVRNREELETALIVLRTVKSQAERYRGHRNAKVAELDADLSDHLTVEIGESYLPADAYAEAIEDAIKSHVLEHPDVLGGRTLKLPSGSIGLRKNPDKVDALEGRSIADVAEHNTDLVRSEVAKVLAKHGIAEFFTFELKADTTAIKSLALKEVIPPERMRKVGFRLVPGEDRCDVKVGD